MASDGILHYFVQFVHHMQSGNEFIYFLRDFNLHGCEHFRWNKCSLYCDERTFLPHDANLLKLVAIVVGRGITLHHWEYK